MHHFPRLNWPIFMANWIGADAAVSIWEVVAQAISEPMYLLTADALLPPYSDLVRRI
jgi:hypothetical protein